MPALLTSSQSLHRVQPATLIACQDASSHTDDQGIDHSTNSNLSTKEPTKRLGEVEEVEWVPDPLNRSQDGTVCHSCVAQ